MTTMAFRITLASASILLFLVGLLTPDPFVDSARLSELLVGAHLGSPDKYCGGGGTCQDCDETNSSCTNPQEIRFCVYFQGLSCIPLEADCGFYVRWWGVGDCTGEYEVIGPCTAPDC